MTEIKYDLSAEHQNWIIDNVGIDNIEYNFRESKLKFLEDEDAVAFKLVFGEYKERNSYFFCPYLPLMHYIEIEIKIEGKL